MRNQKWHYSLSGKARKLSVRVWYRRMSVLALLSILKEILAFFFFFCLFVALASSGVQVSGVRQLSPPIRIACFGTVSGCSCTSGVPLSSVRVCALDVGYVDNGFL